MRIWLSGPRILGGLIRPGISFALSELTKPSRKRGGSLARDPELEANLRNASEHPARLPLRIKIITLLIWLFAVYGFICFIAAIFSAAYAGTCRVYSDGGNTIESCEDGSFTVTDRHGRKRVYGTPNAGFERYPGQEERPVYERRE